VKALWAVPVIAALLAVLLYAVPAYADTPDPDSTPTVEGAYVYRNLLETGDRLFVVYANIPYATPPDTLVSNTFIWRLMSTDGTTELGSTVGYAYHDRGYGYNVYSFYFDAAESITWGQEYIVRLTGNPAVFDDPPTYNFPLSAADYTVFEDSDLNKAELTNRIIILAADLDINWALASDYSLLIDEETGTYLSIYGQVVFRGAIYGVQALAPDAFRTSIVDINAPDREWEETYSENLTSQWSGTWVETAQEAGGDLFSLEYDLLSIIILIVVCFGVMIGDVMLTGDHWNGLIDVAVVMILGARLGQYGIGFLGLIAALAVIYIGAKIWGVMR